MEAGKAGESSRCPYLGGIRVRSFLILVVSFLLVYFVTPWLMYVLLRLVHFSNPGPIQNGVLILASIGVYSFLRKRFGDRLPHI